MGLVLWIDQNTFASGLIEKVFRKKGLEFYTIPHAKDFVYLVEDLKPSVIVVDAATIRADIEAFRNQYESSELLRKTPTLAIGGWSGLEFIQEKRGELSRMLDPFAVPELVNSLLK
jgi:DNA-binding NtrC family response regulator